mgnify:CR=1 FL=1
MTAQVPDWTAPYRAMIRQVAAALGTDHCTGIPDFYADACDEHDLHARTHRTVEGEWLTKNDAALIFKQRIQAMSRFGRWSPMAHWRYWALRWASRYWQHTNVDLANNWWVVLRVRKWPL